MEFQIREFISEDKDEILSMMREFYNSDAVLTNGSDEIFNIDFETCLNNTPLLKGFVFCFEGEILGYSILSQSFSTEYAKVCFWYEDLYVKEKYRGKGIVSRFFKYIKNMYPNAIFKLEVEDENSFAINVYKKAGFKKLQYNLMIML